MLKLVADHFPAGFVLVSTIFRVTVITLHRVSENQIEETSTAVLGLIANLESAPDLSRRGTFFDFLQNPGLLIPFQIDKIFAKHQLTRLIDTLQPGYIVPTVTGKPFGEGSVDVINNPSSPW